MNRQEVSVRRQAMSEDKKVTVYRFSTLPPLPEPMKDETVITPEDFDLSSKMQIRTLDEIKRYEGYASMKDILQIDDEPAGTEQ